MRSRLTQALIGFTALLPLVACAPANQTPTATQEPDSSTPAETSDAPEAAETAESGLDELEDATEEVTPDPALTTASVVLLSQEQINALQGLGVPVAVPTVVPAGFEVDRVRTEVGSGGPGGGAGYEIFYTDNTNRCFAIESTSGGIGSGMALQYRLPVRPGIFTEDYGLNFGQPQDANQPQETEEPLLYSDWMEGNGQFYRLVGAALINEQYPEYSDCEDLPPEIAARVAESLIYLDDEANTQQNLTSDTPSPSPEPSPNP
jgi:hypothetical protein